MADPTKKTRASKQPKIQSKSIGFESNFFESELKAAAVCQIKRIEISGFKSILEPISVEINNITVLAGRNSTGKSSFMQPILLLKQTLESQNNPGVLKINGSNVSFFNSKEFLNNKSNNNNFKIRIYTDEPIGNNFVEWSFVYDDINKDINLEYQWKMVNNNELTLKRKGEIDSLELGKIKSYVDFEDSSEFTIVNAKGFVQNIGIALKDGPIIPFPNFFIESLTDKITSIFHLKGLRSKERHYQSLGVSQGSFYGVFDDYAASVILNWKVLKNNDKIKELNELLVFLEVGTTIDVKKVDEARVQIDISITETSEKVNISDVGLGVSQILPVLVALIEANEDNLVYIEQPEIHLHPNAQYKFAEILVRMANKGKRIIIETHSSLLILGLQTAIGKGEISNKEVGFNWFELEQSTNSTKLNSLYAEPNGSIPNWPADFDSIYLMAELKFLNL